jgi:hypothetical protein
MPMAFADSRTDFSQRFQRAISSPLFFSIAGLWLLLVGMEAVRPCYFLHDDNATWFIGAYVHDFRVLTETGRLAEVNYYQHGGEPFLQQGQTAVLYPPVYLGVALAKACPGDVRWAIDWIAAIHLTIGLLGFYFWLRQGGVAARFAALGGLAWVLNPFVLIVGGSWIFATFVAAWLPWLFWALDYLLVRPSARAAFFLGIIAGLFFLQGYVQWFAYSLLFLGLYALFQFVTRPETRKPDVLRYLAVSVLIFAILSPPLLLPMLHAIDDSAIRASALPVEAALFYSAAPNDFVPAQLCLFQPCFAFGISTVIFYCPALLFLPVTAFRFYDGGAEIRRRLFPLVFLAFLALIFSTRWHVALTMLPLFDKFRWPFKVFVFADFFLIASLVRTAASWTKSRLSSLTAGVCLIVVVGANLAISLAFHDENTFSKTILPASVNPVPPGMDPRRGRVVAFADNLPDSLSYLYLSHAYATYFAFPSLGGYNPLVGQEQLCYALYLDFPNICTGTITPEFQKQFEARSVRYWIVDPHSSQFAEAKSLPGLKRLETDTDRVVFEDMLAAPLVYATAAPEVPCALAYAGNSILIPLSGVTSPVEISVGPTDGWWYRIDRGPWLRPVDQNDRLKIDFRTSDRLLEISYFDSRFRDGLRLSAYLLLLLGVLFMANPLRKRKAVTRQG